MLKLDAADQLFFNRQLEEIEADVVAFARPEIKGRALVPTVFIDPGADFVTTRQMDRVGSAKVISSNAKDLPRVDVSAAEVTKGVRMLGDSFGYTYKEIMRARKAGMSLDRERAETAREVLLRLEDSITALGSANDGLAGLLNNASATASNAPNGAAASPLWSSKTPAEIVADLNSLFANVRTDTAGIFAPDTVLVPESLYTVLAQTPYGSVANPSNATILKFYMETNPWIKSIEPWYYLETAGAGSTKRIVGYKRDPKFVKQHLVDYVQMAPQEQGMETVVNCISQHAGVTLYHPKTVRYLDGV